MALGLIQKNFSNYSAWHYRAKLMPKLEDSNGAFANNSYLIPLATIKSDLAMLKHAFFTDPKDQSPWNYHEWLIQQMTPVQVTGISKTSNGVSLTLSHKVRNFGALDLNIQGVASFETKSLDKNISDKWEIYFEGAGKILIGVKQKKEKNGFESLERIRTFREFKGEFDLDTGSFEA